MELSKTIITEKVVMFGWIRTSGYGQVFNVVRLSMILGTKR